MNIDTVVVLWFVLTGLSVLFITYDLLFRTPEMKVMKLGWILVALYTGPVAFIVYWLSCREPSPGMHETFVAPLWKQSVGSTIHCLAGDATGVIVSAIIVTSFTLPMTADVVIEYIAGFAFGLFVFQALFMRNMLGGSYWSAVRATLLAEWLSMNAVMAGMVPVMTILMSRDMKAMEPTSLRFWGVMSLATLAGALLAIPVNVWLVAKKLKHGMGTERALGKGGTPLPVSHSAGHVPPPPPAAEAIADDHPMGPSSVPAGQKWLVSAGTVAMLVIGVWIAVRGGGFAGHSTMPDMPMKERPGHTMRMK